MNSSKHNKQTLSSHITIHCWAILIQISEKSKLYILLINSQYYGFNSLLLLVHTLKEM
jgi:hypothetical protein